MYPLETIPRIVGIRFHARAVVCQRNQQMTVQRDAMNITVKGLPIDIDLPTGRIRELAGIPQLPRVNEEPVGA